MLIIGVIKYYTHVQTVKEEQASER